MKTLAVVMSMVALCAAAPRAQNEAPGARNVFALKDLALTLTAKGLGVGIVASKSAFLVSPRESSSALAETTSAQDLIAAFNGSQADYHATLGSGVALIQQSNVPERLTKALAMRHLKVRISQPDITMAMLDLARLLEAGSVPEEQGAIGTGVRTEDCPPRARVDVVLDDVTTVDLLNEFVRQVRGVAWLMLFNDEESDTTDWVGFVCSDGTSRRISVSLP